jgi:hypothetical protein
LTETDKQAQPVQDAKSDEPKKTEAALNDKQLDNVTGGTASSLLGSKCATGVHIKEATITH